MLVRIFTIAMNAYREAVRARVLFGLFAVALATIAYSLFVATLSLHQEARVVADIGAASMSLYAVLVAVVVISTSLHREVELKTIFPILSRPVRRHEFLLGKYAGVLTTLGAFLAVDAGAVLLLLAGESGQKPWKIIAAVLALGIALALLLVRAKYTRVFILIPWAFALLAVGYYLAGTAPLDRQLVVASAALTFCEVSIVSSVAMLFASFSSPFLTVIFTVLLVIIGRSADSLAHLPARVVGSALSAAGRGVARVVPNLQIFVPERALLLGQVEGQPVLPYLARAAGLSLFYTMVLLAVSALIFRKRDFQ